MASFPALSNDAETTATVAAAFQAHFGPERTMEAPLVPASEDFGRFASRGGFPSTFWFIGGADADAVGEGLRRRAPGRGDPLQPLALLRPRPGADTLHRHRGDDHCGAVLAPAGLTPPELSSTGWGAGQRPMPPSRRTMPVMVRSRVLGPPGQHGLGQGQDHGGVLGGGAPGGVGGEVEAQPGAVAELHVAVGLGAEHDQVLALEATVPRPLAGATWPMKRVPPVVLPVRGVRHHGGSSPARNGRQRQAVALGGDRRSPIASHSVGKTSTFSVKRSTTVPWASGRRGSRTMPTMWWLSSNQPSFSMRPWSPSCSPWSAVTTTKVSSQTPGSPQRGPQPAQLVVDLADHPEVLRPHVADARLVRRARGLVARARLVQGVPRRARRGDRELDVAGVVALGTSRPRRRTADGAAGSSGGRTRAGPTIVMTEPVDRPLGEEGGEAVLGRPVRLGRQRPARWSR